MVVSNSFDANFSYFRPIQSTIGFLWNWIMGGFKNKTPVFGNIEGEKAFEVAC